MYRKQEAGLSLMGMPSISGAKDGVMFRSFVNSGKERGNKMAKPTSREIWNTLRKIDCSSVTQEKMGLTWRIMQENYPEVEVEWHMSKPPNGEQTDVHYYQGGTASVSCTVSIGEVSREMWLPVMDYKMKSIVHPSSRDISDTKMRCMVKAFSMFGLANYLYSKDALPYKEDASPVAPKKSAPKKSAPKPKTVEVKKPEIDYVAELKSVATDLHNRGWTPEGDTKARIKKAARDGDNDSAKALIKELKKAGTLLLKIDDTQGEG